MLEDDPTFDAGHGSVLTEEMTVEVDAMIMDGYTLESGKNCNHQCFCSFRAVRPNLTWRRSLIVKLTTVQLFWNSIQKAAQDKARLCS